MSILDGMPVRITGPCIALLATPMSDVPVSLHEALSAFKRGLILHALSQFEGNRSRAAAALGIERTSLLRLIRDLEIDDLPRGHRGRPAISAGSHEFTKTCRRCHIDLLRIRALESLPTHNPGRAS